MNNMWQYIFDHTKFDRTPDHYEIRDFIADFHLFSYTLPGNKNVTSYTFDKNGVGDPIAIRKKVEELFGKPAIVVKTDSQMDIRYATENSYVNLVISINKRNTPKKRDVGLTGITIDPKILEAINKVSSKLIVKKKESNNVYALTSGPSGLNITSMGQITQNFNKHNYTENMNDAYAHVCKCLSSKDPCGRLILFQGAPGTGKSYMIKALISEVKSTFIVVGTNLIGDLSGPQILPVLLNQFEEDENSITFILEDADAALATRSRGDLNKLSDVLNLGDGLLGELLDIRLIATTNAGKLELDPAICRPGRMCKHLQFEALTPAQSNEIYEKLTSKGTEDIKSNMTLAEVYRLARKDGWVPDKKALPAQGMYL